MVPASYEVPSWRMSDLAGLWPIRKLSSHPIYLYHCLAVLDLGRVVQSALGNDASLYSLGLHCAIILGATLLASALLFRYCERPFMDRNWHSRRAVPVAGQGQTLSISAPSCDSM